MVYLMSTAGENAAFSGPAIQPGRRLVLSKLRTARLVGLPHGTDQGLDLRFLSRQAVRDGCLRATLRAALREERLAEKALGERQKIEEKSPFQLHAAGLTHSGT